MGHYDEFYEARDREAAEARRRATNTAVVELERALLAAQRLHKSREGAIAVTHIETALLWLKK